MRPGLRVGEINVKPTHLSVKGFQYEDPTSKKRLFQIEEMKIYPSLLSALGGTVQIRRCMLLKPSFFVYRSREGVFIGPFPKAGKEGGETREKSEEGASKGEKREGPDRRCQDRSTSKSRKDPSILKTRRQKGPPPIFS